MSLCLSISNLDISKILSNMFSKLLSKFQFCLFILSLGWFRWGCWTLFRLWIAHITDLGHLCGTGFFQFRQFLGAASIYFHPWLQAITKVEAFTTTSTVNITFMLSAIELTFTSIELIIFSFEAESLPFSYSSIFFECEFYSSENAASWISFLSAYAMNSHVLSQFVRSFPPVCANKEFSSSAIRASGAIWWFWIFSSLSLLLPPLPVHVLLRFPRVSADWSCYKRFLNVPATSSCFLLALLLEEISFSFRKIVSVGLLLELLFPQIYDGLHTCLAKLCRRGDVVLSFPDGV